MRVFVLTFLAMTAFAGNSLLCRQALKRTTIDAASFTFIRILSGAVVLWLVVMLRKGTRPKAGTWASALALFAYAAAFSFVFISLSAGTGVLLLAGLDPAGRGYGALPGAIASGVGYVIWYSALPGVKAASAATVQLSVPVLAAARGILFLGEPITLRFLLASTAVLGGIAID